MSVIRRISKILALAVVYIICAYGYLTAKGFIFTKDGAFFSNSAEAKEAGFAQKIAGNLTIAKEQIRSKGKMDAPLVMYGYSSMACSHCKEFHKFILPKIERDFISTGKLRFVFVHFPVDIVSMKAAKLSYCLPENKYYDFISELYDKRDWQFSEKDELLNKYAAKFGLTEEDLEKCRQNSKLTSDILLTRNTAVENFGIIATPSFIIEGKDGKELIVGSKNYDELKDYLADRLEKVKK